MSTSALVSGPELRSELGALPTTSAPELGGAAIRAALEHGTVAASNVDAVVMGNVVQVGGTESMTQAPHLAMGARSGYKYGAGLLVNALDHDPFLDVHRAIIEAWSA